MDEKRRNPAFARMISDYVRLRGSPLLPPRAVEQLRAYLVDLFQRDGRVPLNGRGIDWTALAQEAGIEPELMLPARKALTPGVEALRRELRKPGRRRAQPKPRAAAGAVAPASQRPRPTKSPRAPAERRAAAALPDLPPREPKPRRGRKPAASIPFWEHPTPVEGPWEDPEQFHAALTLHMRRHRETAYRLARVLESASHPIETSTLRMWRVGAKAPTHRDSFAILAFLETRWRLPAGYFKAKLPHPSRAVAGQDIPGINSAERRRLAWHLPDDFHRRPREEQEEILEWVRRVVVSGATDYRRYQAAAAKQPFGVRFPGLQGVRKSVGTRFDEEGHPTAGFLAPGHLAAEMEALLAFKSATLTPMGYRRRGVWGAETSSQKVEHFGLMLGALAASPRSGVRGAGVPVQALSFGLLVFPSVWDWYLRWREARRGFYTAWEEDMLNIAAGLTSAETGWLTQTPQLAERLTPLPGLLSQADIALAQADWPATCEKLHRFAIARAREISRSPAYIAIRSSRSCRCWRPTARWASTAASPTRSCACGPVAGATRGRRPRAHARSC